MTLFRLRRRTYVPKKMATTRIDRNCGFPFSALPAACYTPFMSTLSTATPRGHITASPDVCGGRPCIAGTRIRVHDIYVWHELQGLSPDQIVHEFSQLTLADVYAALSYFWDHRDAMLAQIEADRHEVEQVKLKKPLSLAGKAARPEE